MSSQHETSAPWRGHGNRFPMPGLKLRSDAFGNITEPGWCSSGYDPPPTPSATPDPPEMTRFFEEAENAAGLPTGAKVPSVPGVRQAPTMRFDRNELFARSAWLVVHACWEGGGTGHGPHDIYFDGWLVTVGRLDAAGRLTDDRLNFYVRHSGSFVEEVTVNERDLRVVA